MRNGLVPATRVRAELDVERLAQFSLLAQDMHCAAIGSGQQHAASGVQKLLHLRLLVALPAMAATTVTVSIAQRSHVTVIGASRVKFQFSLAIPDIGLVNVIRVAIRAA